MITAHASTLPKPESAGVSPTITSARAEPRFPNPAFDELARLVSSNTVIKVDEPLARKTTLRVGGHADLFIEPSGETDLATILKFCSEHTLPFFVLGRGSNLLVKDGGFHGVVVSLVQTFFSRVERVGQTLKCGAGARVKAVAMEARRNHLAGMEFLEGIPGTVGGALRMNAGAMGSATFDLVESVRLMDFHGKISERTPADLQVEYRSCHDLKRNIALSAVFRGQPGSRETIEALMSEFSRKRWRSQPAAPSAGCVFKNPITIPAGKLIEELGLKGARVGGALVSQEHGNFIITESGATAANVLELIALIQARARERRGLELHTEVEIIGD